jgi:hypothetical protein
MNSDKRKIRLKRRRRREHEECEDAKQFRNAFERKASSYRCSSAFIGG